VDATTLLAGTVLTRALGIWVWFRLMLVQRLDLKEVAAIVVIAFRLIGVLWDTVEALACGYEVLKGCS
jgi:hypothetical protein